MGCGGSGSERPVTQVPIAGVVGRGSWDSDSPEMDTDGEISLSRAPMSDADSLPLPLSSPPSEVVRALEADLCSHPRASRRVVLVPQSPDGTLRSVHDVVDLAPSVNGSVRRCSVLVSPILVEPSVQVPSTIPASSRAVRDVHRGETIVDSSDDEPLARRVPAVLEGSPARTHRDSDVQVSLGSRRLDNEELEGNTVPGVRLQNRFSPLGEAPIVREPAVYPMTEPETASTDPAFGVGPVEHRNASLSARKGGISRAHWSSPKRRGGRFRRSQFVFSGRFWWFLGSCQRWQRCPQFGLQLQ